jgi:hypothetical protein
MIAKSSNDLSTTGTGARDNMVARRSAGVME